MESCLRRQYKWNIYDRAEIFELGDYISIGDEIAYVIRSDPINNTMTVKRGVKGTVPMSHDKDTRMETISNGLRIILSKNRYCKFADSINLYDIMTWKGITTSSIIDQIKNINKYDTIYINNGFDPERISVVGVSSGEYKNYLYVKDSLLPQFAGTEIQKQIIYDIPIIYLGEETNIYGILYVDEKITDDVVVDIDILIVL